MTSLIKVEAHCDVDKEVVISINTKNSGEVYYLKNGESKEIHVYDDKEIKINERVQQTEF